MKDKARTYTKQVSKERQKKHGEVFTPPELIREMLDELPAKIFKPGMTCLEPAAGDGNFVVEMLKYKMKWGGCTPTQALQDVFAVELLADNVKAMKKRVLELCRDTEEHRKIFDINIAHANFLDPNDTDEGRKYPDWLRDDGHNPHKR